eukprot:scaffold3273_cov126-Isochrysis_galbana.AAC.3
MGPAQRCGLKTVWPSPQLFFKLVAHQSGVLKTPAQLRVLSLQAIYLGLQGFQVLLLPRTGRGSGPPVARHPLRFPRVVLGHYTRRTVVVGALARGTSSRLDRMFREADNQGRIRCAILRWRKIHVAALKLRTAKD